VPVLLTTRPADLDVTLADTPWRPTPCPDDQERVGCILAGVVVDESTGEMMAPYFTEGFSPELEPASFHLHFYLDSVVAGDERKAGTEVTGGGWKPWDAPFPFSSFGGENGRTGFTVADAEAASARQLCVVVADADQRAIPGSGNCAPIAQLWDQAVLSEQVNRLEGRFVGRCSIGATAIVPDGWRPIDLVATPVEDAARALRPNGVAEMTATLQALIDDGGVLWVDGPAVEGLVVNATISRIEGAFTASDSPDTVRASLAQLRIDLGDMSEKQLVGRALATRTEGLETTNRITYVVPDFGYALIVTFEVPQSAEWVGIADSIAGTINGC